MGGYENVYFLQYYLARAADATRSAPVIARIGHGINKTVVHKARAPYWQVNLKRNLVSWIFLFFNSSQIYYNRMVPSQHKWNFEFFLLQGTWTTLSYKFFPKSLIFENGKQLSNFLEYSHPTT